jgi:hypothetical protein
MKMTMGRELDDLVTEIYCKEKACKHKLRTDDCGSWCSENCEDVVSYRHSADVNASRHLLDKLQEKNHKIQITSVGDSKWTCQIDSVIEEGDTMALAICYALITIGKQTT